MEQQKQIKTALISVFDKGGLEPIIKKLESLNVEIYSTGGTQKFIEEAGVAVTPVESLTSYPSILGGRVKTLHPKVFGGILGRRELDDDVAQLEEYDIPELDLVIVDLYPFEETLASGAFHEDIIEKIDIGGISLIRAAAKNYKDVVIVPSKDQYGDLLQILEEGNGNTAIKDRQKLAAYAFNVSSHYDTQIFNWFNTDREVSAFKASQMKGRSLRYGENPHQKGEFYGDLEFLFNQIHGKELSYNNLLDVDAAVNLMSEFQNEDPTFAILKHNNACGLATRSTIHAAYKDALAGDPVSAFGGVLISNQAINKATAEEMNSLFFEILIAPSFENDAMEVLQSKKNRILLLQRNWPSQTRTARTILNGVLVQDKDHVTDSKSKFELKTNAAPTESQLDDLVFASKIAKHTKSNTIVLAKGGQLLASGTGQTSRVDALKQAIEKAKNFKFDLQNAVMASDAFFPFPDCVEIAGKEGINAVIQPGGSIKDQLSVDYCNENNIAMVFTGHRHFKH